MYRLPIFFGVVILILVIGFLLIFGGRGDKSSKPKPGSSSQIQPLPTYASTNARVSLTIDGVVNGDDAHRAIKITVSRDQRQLDIIQGYSGHVISKKSLYNTQAAYAVFLRAINDGGFLSKLAKSNYPADERGQCAAGIRYIFELSQNGKALSRLWASDCGNSVGTLGGNAFFMLDLFEAQITNFQDLTQEVNL